MLKLLKDKPLNFTFIVFNNFKLKRKCKHKRNTIPYHPSIRTRYDISFDESFREYNNIFDEFEVAKLSEKGWHYDVIKYQFYSLKLISSLRGFGIMESLENKLTAQSN